jgi:oligosaccharide repeat unit polymerase
MLDRQVTLFDGYLVFNPWLLLLGGLMVAHAIFHYYRYCYRVGFKVDIWSTNVILFLVSTVGIYPFASSDENGRSVGSHMWEISANVDRAFLLTAVGYAFAVGGFYLHSAFIPRRPQQRLKSHQFMARILGVVLTKTTGLKLMTLGCVAAQIAITAIVFERTGQLFNLREAVIDDDKIRPFYNFVFASASPFFMMWWLVEYYRAKRIQALLWLMPLAVLTLVGGIRGPLVAPFVTVMPLYWMTQRLEVRLWKIALLAAFVLVLAVGFGELRHAGDRSALSMKAKFGGELAFGNSLSDDRDFAWVLTGWDGDLLLGKTYLAGFLDFIPRQLMPYREEWGLGKFTTRMAGLNSDIHAGLRPGIFGEAYFNFGICGIVLMGLITGFIWRLYDFHAKQEVYLGRGVVYIYRWVTPSIFLTGLQITAGAFRFYVFVVLALVAYALAMFQANAPANKARRELAQVAG